MASTSSISYTSASGATTFEVPPPWGSLAVTVGGSSSTAFSVVASETQNKKNVVFTAGQASGAAIVLTQTYASGAQDEVISGDLTVDGDAAISGDTLMIANLPTSSAGLATGQIYVSAAALKMA